MVNTFLAYQFSSFFFQNSILFLLIFTIVVKSKNLVLWSSIGSHFILNSYLLWSSHSLTLVRLMFSSVYSSFIDFVNSFSLNWIKPNMFLFHHLKSCLLPFFFFFFFFFFWQECIEESLLYLFFPKFCNDSSPGLFKEERLGSTLISPICVYKVGGLRLWLGSF